MLDGDIETLTFDKKTDTMMITHIKFFCHKRRICHTLGSIKAVRAMLKGSKKGGINTLHYVLMIFTDEGHTYKVMWSKNEHRIKKQLMLLRKFLEIELDKPIDVIDNATLEFEKKSFGKKVVETMRRMKRPVITADPCNV